MMTAYCINLRKSARSAGNYPTSRFNSMMKFLFHSFLFISFSTLAGPSDSTAWQKKDHTTFTFSYQDADQNISNEIDLDLDKGISRITSFFGREFANKFQVFLFPNRASLDKQWQTDWGLPGFKAECWMVASGVAQRLDILSPNTWKKETCEHDATDKKEVASLILHELVHVFHGQQNPKPDFTGLDDLSWLIEGVATYASGQLNKRRLESVRKGVADGKAPAALEDFWKGKDKYGLAGSLVKYVDKKYGRFVLFELLGQTDEKSILEILKTDEPGLIEAWKKSIKK